ncbi:MAG: hypothetical protein RIE06_33735 [Roseibium album]|uniref:hypothetical protein n=1 Tax=Roseibium album TaxID=311410 RepID=UPI0032EC6110
MDSQDMQGISIAHRIYFFAVCSFGLYVGVMGYFNPALISYAIPFDLPPLHARVIASLYLAGGTMMFLAGLAKYPHQIRLSTIVATIWTGSLGIVTLIYIQEFDLTQRRTLFWFFAYSVYPILGLFFIISTPKSSVLVDDDPFPEVDRSLLRIVGVLALVLSCLLLYTPELMVENWPWKTNRMLAQVYGGPLLGLATITLLMTTAGSKDECFISCIGITLFLVLVLSASLLHVELFSPFEIASVMWFGGLLFASFVIVLVLTSFLGRPQEARKDIEREKRI